MAHRSSSAGICRGGVPSSILEDLQLVKPTILFAVPTLHKRIYDCVHNLMETASPIRKGLMKKALLLALGRKKSDEKKGLISMSFMENIQFNTLDKIVLFKIRDRFGGRLKRGYVGGAALPSEVINFLDDVGIPICEGYQWTYAAVVAELQYSVHRILYAGKLVLEDLLSRIMVFKQSRICTPCCSATFKLHFLTASVW